MSNDVISDVEVLDSEAAAFPLLKRLSLASINSAITDAQQDAHTVSSMGGDVSYLAESQSQEGQATQLPSLIGTCVHEVFEQLAKLEQRSLSDDAMQTQQAIWRCRLLQLGVKPQQVDDALNTVVTAVQAVLNNTDGQWIFDASHRAAQNEWPLSCLSDEVPSSVYHYVIDRSFIDENNVRWIIDYKISAPSGAVTADDFVEQQKKQYSAQLSQYKNAVTQFDRASGESVVETKCALYFPLINRLAELGDS